MKPQRRRDVILGSFAGLTLLVNVLFSVGPTLGLAAYLGYWSYPVFLFINVMLVILVFRVLLPTDYGWTKGLPKIFRRFLAWVRSIFATDHNRFRQGKVWGFFHSKGAFWIILVGTITISPIVGACTARYLKLPEDKAWRYTMWSVLIATGTNITLYLGAWKIIKNWAGV